MSSVEARRHTVAQLARQLRRLERPSEPRNECGLGIPPLDAVLPDGGLRAGTLWEWFSDAGGSGGFTLLLLSAARWMGESGKLVVIDPQGEFYPPAAVRLGIDLSRTVVVRPRRSADTCWALEQALRCRGVAASVCWLSSLDSRTFRRLQLAAEAGKGVGFLWRPSSCRGQPSWADVRLHIQPLPSSTTARRFRLERIGGRGGGRRRVELELNDETGAVRLVTSLAAPATVARAAGA